MSAIFAIRLYPLLCIGGALALHMAAHAQVTPGTALRFNADSYVSIAANPAYNAFPFTMSVWVRTTNVIAGPDPIVSRYTSSSFRGWSVHAVNGRVRAWFFRDPGNYIWNPAADGQGVDGGFIADGRWHYLTFSVDSAGGRLFVDGVLRGAMNWTGTPGVPTSTAPLHFGAIAGFGTFFRGDIDEVSLWNYALTNDSVNYVKHRQLTGREDGLISYWRLDEGVGTTVAETSPTLRSGFFVGPTQWIPSTAPIALSPVALSAGRFDGGTADVSVPHDAALNSLPITFMAWVRTSQAFGDWPGIISKYTGGSLNGWALALSQGRVYPWYYRDGANYVDPSPFASAGDRFIADGQWHHIAFAVDDVSGRTFIDGRLVHTEPWVGTPTATTSSEAVHFGRYVGGLTFNGQIDRVSVWNTALTTADVQRYAHLPLAGGEAGLIAAYEFDEASGTLVTELTGTHNGTASGAFARVGSLARMGDGSQHLLTSLDYAGYARLWNIDNTPAFNGFPVPTIATMRRFHDYGPAPAIVNVTATLSGVLNDSGGNPVALENAAETNFTFNLPSENANAPATNSVTNLTANLNLDPVQLASASETHSAVISFTHSEDGGAVVDDASSALPLLRLLDFNGTLLFGAIETRFTSVNNQPQPGIVSGDRVGSLLQISSNAGYLVAKPTHTFGNGGSFANVNLFDDGHAEATSAGLNVNGPVPDREVLNGITFDRTSLILRQTGADATIVLHFPVGFSVVTGTLSNRITNARWNFPMATLDETLMPTALSFRIDGTQVFGVEESKPFWMQSSVLEWTLGDGTLTMLEPVSLHFVRQQEDAGHITTRVSNDGYWRNLPAATGNTVVRADTNGTALLTIDVNLGATPFRPHFPYSGPTTNEFIQTSGGFVRITDDLLIVDQSYVDLAGNIPVAYARDCADRSCNPLQTNGPQIMPFTANANQLRLTEDGGLMAYGSVPAQNLTWGYLGGGNNYAHRTSDVQDGAYHMAGIFLLGSRADPPLKPSVLLMTGAGDAVDPNYIERPGFAGYYDGFANYAGVNFRAPATGHSILATLPTGNYPLVPEAKYYARFGGISGIHQAESFPSQLPLYGYNFTFTRFALSFLDSETHKSLTDGAIHFPTQPAGFVQEFQQMKFLCRGGIDEAKIPPGLDPKHLNYWNVDFTPLTLQFKSQTNSTACNDANRRLVLGVETKIPFIPEAFHAALGFHPNGNLVTAFDGYPVDSRFKVPAQLSMRGPGGSHYRISTASDGYFNNWDVPNRPVAGFYNLVGRMDVFFFEDVKVQLHVTPTGPETSDIDIMGGWRATDKTGKDEGWKVGAQTYFNHAKFDERHVGFPTPNVDAYRNSPTTEFRPRAQKDWIEVAKFDYPLAWNKGLRQFASFEDSTVILPVINVSSRMKTLTPGKADIDFHQDLELKLPRIKGLDFANDALNEINGVADSFSNAVRQALGGAIDSTGLTRGLRSLQGALRDQMDGFFRPILGPTLDPVVDRMYPLLSEQLRTNAQNFLPNVSTIVASTTVGLKDSIRQVNSVAGNPNGVVGKLNATLTDVDDTLGLLLRVVEKDAQGRRHVVRVLLQKIAQDQGPGLGIVADIGDGLANQLLADLEPTLADLEQQLRDLKNEFAAVRTQVSLVSGDFNRALNSITAPAGAFDQYQTLAVVAVSNLMASSITPAGDYFTANPAAAKQQIRERLIAAFMNSTVPARYQQTFKQFLYDDDALLNTLMDTLFQQVNLAIRNGISEQLAGATDGIFKDMKGPGGMGDTLASAQIRGAPTFNGDALKKIRLDAKVQMEFPDELQFNAYMQITELDSQSVPLGCIPTGAPAAEVRIGARDVPLNWIGIPALKPLTLTIEARWTLQSGNVIGVGGLIEINGEVGFKGCSVKQIGATMAIGEVENYFACKAAGTVTILGIPVNVHVGLFVGDACTLEPLIFIHPDAPKTLENAISFAGVYLNFGGGLSLSEILFGTSSCFLDIEATIDTVLYYQGGTGFGRIGMRQAQKISADVICFISASVEVVLFSTLTVTPSGTSLTLGGSGELCGKIGFCPFCIKGCVGITIKGTVGDGGIDYSVDI